MSKHLSPAEDVISNQVDLLNFHANKQNCQRAFFMSIEDYLLTMIFISGDANYGNRQPSLV